jgi:ankyrin repeat protein
MVVASCAAVCLMGCQAATTWDYVTRRDFVSAARSAAKGGDPDLLDQDGWTVLHHASYCGNPDDVVAVLDSGADPNIHATAAGWNAAMAAADAERWENVRLLLDRGTDVEAKDRFGQTLLHYAARQCNAEALRMLIDRGVDVNSLSANKRSALFYAIDDAANSAACVQVLLDAGADLHDGTNGASELGRAEWLSRQDLVSLLNRDRTTAP